jgi:hypothetical protein
MEIDLRSNTVPHPEKIHRDIQITFKLKTSHQYDLMKKNL